MIGILSLGIAKDKPFTLILDGKEEEDLPTNISSLFTLSVEDASGFTGYTASSEELEFIFVDDEGTFDGDGLRL